MVKNNKLKHSQLLQVEVAYARFQEQHIIALEVDLGCTIERAIDRSGMIDIYPEIDLTTQKVGVFGKLKKLTDWVQAGDRIEIYRPLKINPKEARKKRAVNKAIKRNR